MGAGGNSCGGHGLWGGAGCRVAAAGRLRLGFAGLLAVLGFDLGVLRCRRRLLRGATLSAELLFPARAADTTERQSKRRCPTP